MYGIKMDLRRRGRRFPKKKIQKKRRVGEWGKKSSPHSFYS
jgi:hypothetical protein